NTKQDAIGVCTPTRPLLRQKQVIEKQFMSALVEPLKHQFRASGESALACSVLPAKMDLASKRIGVEARRSALSRRQVPALDQCEEPAASRLRSRSDRPA